MNYKQRMIIEYKDLAIKIDRIYKFLETVRENKEQNNLLNKQLEAMEIYRDLLEERIFKLLED